MTQPDRPPSAVAAVAPEREETTGRLVEQTRPRVFDAAFLAWAMQAPMLACVYDPRSLLVRQSNAAAGSHRVGHPVFDLCGADAHPQLIAALTANAGLWPAGVWPVFDADGTVHSSDIISGQTDDGVLLLASRAVPTSHDMNVQTRAVQARLDRCTDQFGEACRLARMRLWELTAPPGVPSLAELVSPPATDFADLDDAIELALGQVHPDDRQSVRGAVASCIADNGRLEIEFRTIAPRRRVMFWRASGGCRADPNGVVTCIDGVCQDVSDRREAELAVQQTEKWKSLGQLTGGIAHDFNNLLTVISTNLEMLVETIGVQQDLLEFIDPARKAANSGADLTARLLAFAQRQPLRPELVQLGPFLTSLRDLAVRTIGGRYTIDVTCPADVAPCRLDRAQLEGALLNLIVNARDAMPAGGRIAIEASNALVAAGGADAPRPGDFVRICVTDEGGGIAPEIIDRVFEPFFTTKAVGKGTGLGLSMVQGFAQQSGGEVRIVTRPGHGTRVILHLPQAVGESDAVPALAAVSDWHPLPFRALVVDDSPDVLRAMTRMCDRIGLQPVPAASADEALAHLRGGATFDLLLTDVILPGRLGGADIAREARRLQPTIRILYTSGYTHADIVNHAKLDPTIEMLVKPFSRPQLLAALRVVLGGSVPAAAA